VETGQRVQGETRRIVEAIIRNRRKGEREKENKKMNAQKKRKEKASLAPVLLFSC
jgi:hypothetical protein